MRHIFILITILATLKNATPEFNRVYDLTSGLYEAVEITVLNSTVHKLIGVPYSNIPKSFDKPSPINKSSSFSSAKAKKADKWSALCVQPILFNHGYYGNFKLPHEYEMTLDCLSVNLFLPKKAENKGKLLTAMLFVHGGSNAAGTSSFIDASALASQGNVVVASPNYRLDVLGFLNINANNETSRIKGNNGLWDLVLSLEWLYNNCEALGCNKSSITVFGHSAGSSDTMLLAQTKQARKYISRIVMQSGSGLAHWAFSYEAFLHQKISSLSREKSLSPSETQRLISLTGYDRSRYVSSLNDSFNNFITHTTCNLTLKHDCLVEKIKNFYRVYSIFELNTNMPDYSAKSVNIAKKLKKIFDTLDLKEAISVFNYFHNELMLNSLFRPNSKKQSSSDEMTLNSFEKILKTLDLDSPFDDREFKQLLERTSPDVELSLAESDRYKSDPCYADMMHFISGSANLELACDFIISSRFTMLVIVRQEERSFVVALVRYFLSCFELYYEREEMGDRSSLLELILAQKVGVVVNEMRTCVEQANRFTLEAKMRPSSGHQKGSSKKISDWSESGIANAIIEFSFLTANANYLHRPNLDLDLIERMPHDYINGLVDDEVIV